MKMASYDTQCWSGGKQSDKLLAQQWMQDWQFLGTQTTSGGGLKMQFTATVSNSASPFVAYPSSTQLIVNNDGTSVTVVSGTLVPVIGNAPGSNTAVAMTDPPPPVPLPARRPAPLAFSPYINATELVLEFMAEAKALIPGLTRERFLKLTIADFFAFLIRRAAETDGVAPPEMQAGEIPNLLRRPRCGWCGRFLARRLELARVYHCGVPCLERAAARDGLRLAGARR